VPSPFHLTKQTVALPASSLMSFLQLDVTQISASKQVQGTWIMWKPQLGHHKQPRGCLAFLDVPLRLLFDLRRPKQQA
jgi:hypothetical protein